ncbi:unnamed protein product [Fraxinus pennsylvanica]|uniref:Uncharacterized protein n=1 Tax=Fraxinus pennsylvanica TaxID=56036 RepID=A0AAD1ZVZ0_9LAMI|nr:unnamed protein product [Fraxinus pennsylvanica]
MMLMSSTLPINQPSNLALPNELVNTARRSALDSLEQKRPWINSFYRIYIDVIEGIISGPRAGLGKEAEAFQGLLHSDTCKSSVHIFFAQRGSRHQRSRLETKANQQGSDTWWRAFMGSGIATALILSNYPVIRKDVSDKFLQAGIDRVKANLKREHESREV